MNLELKDVLHGFPGSSWRLRVKSFSVPPGEVKAVIGPNGSGKSTLLRIAAGILRPDEGRIFLDGADLSRMRRADVARKLGYLPQETISHVDFTVEELVRLGRFPHTGLFGGEKPGNRKVIGECLEQTGMGRLSGRPLSRLSGGERKRAFLAAVLAQQPDILLLDEPTASLDMHHQVRFFRLLRGLARRGLGIAVVTHDINFASLFGDRLFLLHEGRPLAWGTPNEALRPDILKAAYGSSALLIRHPAADRPALLPSPGKDFSE